MNEEPKRDLIAEMQGDKPTQSLDDFELGEACKVTDPDCEACQ